MKISAQLNNPEFYIEAGIIYRQAARLERMGIQVVFEQEGMRVGTTYDDSVRQEYFYTGRELKFYADGLIDGVSAPDNGKVKISQRD